MATSSTKKRPQIVPPTPANLEAAGRLIRAGRLVAFPTETVYGLGADATHGRAVAAIFAAKDRPRFNPLIVHLADRAAAEEAVVFNERAERLAEHLWPGALTLVLPRAAGSAISPLTSAGLDTLAIRVPGHHVTQALIAAGARPIAAPSANRSGAVSPTTAAHVAESLRSRVDMIIDGGPCPIGIESTVVDLTRPQPALLRPGGVTQEDIEAVIGPLAAAAEEGGAPRSPGRLVRHYAPRLPLRLEAEEARPGEAYLAFGAHEAADAATVLNLSPAGDLPEAAANLFAMLRRLDRPEFTAIAVAPIPEAGLGRAINDRLRHAATATADRPLAGGGAMG